MEKKKQGLLARIGQIIMAITLLLTATNIVNITGSIILLVIGALFMAYDRKTKRTGNS